jgi:hypothetical protein
MNGVIRRMASRRNLIGHGNLLGTVNSLTWNYFYDNVLTTNKMIAMIIKRWISLPPILKMKPRSQRTKSTLRIVQIIH